MQAAIGRRRRETAAVRADRQRRQRPVAKILGLRHLALNVRDPQASKRFYCERFGMRVVWEPDPDNVYLSSGPDNLALHRAPVPAAGALDHLGFIVETKDRPLED